MSLKQIVDKNCGDFEPYNSYKLAERYIKNVLESFGVNLSDLKKKSERNYEYEITQRLENILTPHIQNNDFPTKTMMEKALGNETQYPTLVQNMTTVVKDFLESNFDKESLKEYADKINAKIQAIRDALRNHSKTLTSASDVLDSNQLSIMFLSVIDKSDILSLYEEILYRLNNNYNFKDILNLIHINHQLDDIQRIINRAKKSDYSHKIFDDYISDL